MTQKPLTARIEVFRPGTFKPMDGEAITYSAADLKAMADAYSPDTAPAPIVVGHPSTDAPAFGWVEKFDYDQNAERLYATLTDIEPQFAEMVKAGRFKKVSMAFFAPKTTHNPIPGSWYPKHLGFLGAAAPAVSGLKNAAFAGAADVIFTAQFGERGFEETASILRSLRDWLIGREGLEAADMALPSYRIEWLSEIELSDRHAMSGPAYAAKPNPADPQKEPTVPQDKTDAAFAAREEDLTKRLAAVVEREAEIAHTDHVTFAEALVNEGRLLPVLKDKVVAIFDALPGHASVAFSEGAEKITAGAALREVLQALPKVVSFGEANLGEDPAGGKTAAFAADGKDVDTAGLATHNKALEYQRAHPGTTYIDAVKAVS